VGPSGRHAAARAGHGVSIGCRASCRGATSPAPPRSALRCSGRESSTSWSERVCDSEHYGGVPECLGTYQVTVSAPGYLAKTQTIVMHDGRMPFVSVLLSSGNVLFAGGCSGPGVASVCAGLSSIEIYDAMTEKFSATGRMNTARYHHTATLLSAELCRPQRHRRSRMRVPTTRASMRATAAWTRVVLTPVPRRAPPPPARDDHDDKCATSSAKQRPPTHRSGHRPWRELLKRSFKMEWCPNMQ
jgi:hypothetical protein